MTGPPDSTSSLYDLLAEPAPAGSPAGETNITRAKETIDNDVEGFAVEELMQHA
jgi:hypothetical protein